ncbi:MAG: hypothetical protein WC788_02265 [Candidatus Paceibacterota bacterium]|jgi:hypothetical protein
MEELNEEEEKAINKMKQKIKLDLQSHFEDGRDINVEVNRQPFHWPGIKYDSSRITYLLLEALKQATAELQTEWVNAAA